MFVFTVKMFVLFLLFLCVDAYLTWQCPSSDNFVSCSFCVVNGNNTRDPAAVENERDEWVQVSELF